ncbi:glycoside hydrolase domain-containing protein, partial [Streptomyces prunicolor]
YAGAPYKTQETVRAAMKQLWSTDPAGIPGNDGSAGPYGGVGGARDAGGCDRQRTVVRVEFEYGGVVVAGRQQGFGDVVGGEVHLGGEAVGYAVGEAYLYVTAGGPALVGEQVERLDGGLGA